MKRKMSIAFCLSFLAIGLWASTGSAALVPVETVVFQVIGDVVIDQDSYQRRGTTAVLDPGFWYKLNGGSWNQINDANDITINGGGTIQFGIWGNKADVSAPVITSANSTGRGVDFGPAPSESNVVGLDYYIRWNDGTSGSTTVTLAATGLTVTGTGTMTSPALNPVPIPAAAWLLGSGLVGLVAIRRRMKK